MPPLSCLHVANAMEHYGDFFRCMDGKIQMEDVYFQQPVPKELRMVMLSNDAERANAGGFMGKSRMYYNVLQMASSTADIPQTREVHFMRIGGTISHRIGAILPSEGELSQFAQSHAL